jgi:hypothetical protein
LGSLDKEDHNSRQIVCKTHFQNNQKKMDWRHGSSAKYKALSSNPRATKKEKRRRRRNG